MTANELRKKFIDFFVSKGHVQISGASVIPENDPTGLFTTAGMHPLVPYLLGQPHPAGQRLTDYQKCIRTGDIDNVGLTARHGTFFEMLGNFSFGDYFKEESLAWGVEFLTKELGFEMEKLWATVYFDDEQAKGIWKSLGMDPSHIVPLGKEDNFWEIGLGPCGPDSEIFYDRGEEYGCGSPDCKPGCDCDRFLEIWNHVFTQFSKEEDGSYTDLSHPNIDTGMGLERMACVMQNTDSIFDVDTIRHILNAIVDKSGIEYKDGQTQTDISIRIITDHLRAMTFMIADGIMPSNEGRGYVLRRIIRRAARHGRNLGIEGTFLAELTNTVMEVSGEAYPEIIEKKDYIQKIILVEEEKFASTIGQGEEIIKDYVNELKAANKCILDGAKAFKLYDTYGFPIELTEEIIAENKMTVDRAGFEENMKAQKERARKGRKNTDVLRAGERDVRGEQRLPDSLGHLPRGVRKREVPRGGDEKRVFRSSRRRRRRAVHGQLSRVDHRVLEHSRLRLPSAALESPALRRPALGGNKRGARRSGRFRGQDLRSAHGPCRSARERLA